MPSVSCSASPATPKLAPPSPFPPPPAVPQAKQYGRFTINDDLLKDIHKQLRKPGNKIRNIPRRTDMKLPCPVAKPFELTRSLPLPAPS
jgi:hypothetical protein